MSATGRQRLAQVPARGDAELPEHLPQVPFDGAGADEQLGGDLRVGPSVTGQPGDVLLLGGELVERVGLALADLLAGGEQLAACALGERLDAQLGEGVVGRAELLAGIDCACPRGAATRRTAAGRGPARAAAGCGQPVTASS